MIDSAREEDGVIGYQDNMLIPPKIQPKAAASLPSIRNVFGSLSRASTVYPMSQFQFSLAYSRPSEMAWRFNSIAFSLPLNC